MGSLVVVEGGGGEGVEELVVCIYGFDDYEVFLEVFEFVDLDGFEEVCLGVLYDGLVGGVEVVGEVVDGYVGVVDVVVVIVEEEVYGCGVCNEGLVDGIGVGVGDVVCEEWLCGFLVVGVCRISRGFIEEWLLFLLVCKDLDVFGCEVEECRSDGVVVYSVLVGIVYLVEVVEEVEVYGIIGVFVFGGIYEMFVLVWSNGEVFEGGLVVFGLCENVVGGLVVVGREIILCGGGVDE